MTGLLVPLAGLGVAIAWVAFFGIGQPSETRFASDCMVIRSV